MQSRPGWRLLWECLCTSEPALKTSKAARYIFGASGSSAVCESGVVYEQVGVLSFDKGLDLCSLGAARTDR